MSEATDSKTHFDPIKLFGQAVAYIKHLRLMLLMLALGLLAGIGYFLYATPVFEARSLVYFQVFGGAVRSGDMPEVSQGRIARDLLSQLSSRRNQLAAARRLGLLSDEDTFEDVLNHVAKVRIGIIDARHLEVTVSAYQPEVVRAFARTLIDVYLESQQESWQEFRDQALERYAVQLEELETKVSENVAAIAKLERDENLTEVTIEQQSLLEIPKQVVQNRERLIRMDGVRDIVERLESELNQAGREGDTNKGDAPQIVALLSLLSSFEKDTAVNVGTVIRRPISGGTGAIASTPSNVTTIIDPAQAEGIEPWRELEKEKRRLTTAIAEASKTYLSDHPVMVELEAELEKTRKGLVTELELMRQKFESEYAKLEENLAQLQARMPEYERITEELGQSAMAYSSVEQTQRMWDRARDTMADKLAVITFSEEFDWINLRFKEHISLRDEDPVSPAKKKLAIIALLLGLGGAVGVPTVLNLFNTTVTDMTAAERTTGLSGLGIVPLTEKEELESVNRSPAQGAAVPNYLLETFRIIRSNIILKTERDQKAQVVMVTSSRPGEGKTTLAANLAWAFHSMGERTLIIDCDLRRGRVHELFKLNNGSGTSKLLLDEVDLNEAILPTEVELLNAIPRGPVIVGTTELLFQSGFATKLESLRKVYDRIILDTPPILGLSETSSLQSLADGVVVVIRAGKTPGKDFQDAVGLMKKTGANIFGFVLNAVDLSEASNYYTYYYYSAPYYDQFDDTSQEGRSTGTAV